MLPPLTTDSLLLATYYLLLTIYYLLLTSDCLLQDGVLTCSELASGFAYLGLKMTPAEIYAVVRAADANGDGLISVEDWKAWLGAGVDEELTPAFHGGSVDLGSIVIEPQSITEINNDVPATTAAGSVVPVLGPCRRCI